ncbi:MAG: AbrB/MazE/SpoVT family DNA-binding domain-containing protein [Smithellaceae bacterium]|jgi:AbrB family looped-hinge helix DNA binding protein
MSLIKLNRHGQITIPANLRKHLNIGEGSYLEIKKEGGAIILKPVKVVDVEESSLKNNREA